MDAELSCGTADPPTSSPGSSSMQGVRIHDSWPPMPGVIIREQFKQLLLEGNGVLAEEPFVANDWAAIGKNAVHPRVLHGVRNLSDYYIGTPQVDEQADDKHVSQWMRLSAIPPTIRRLNVRQPGRRAFRRRTITRKRDGRWRVQTSPHPQIIFITFFVVGIIMGVGLVADWTIGGANPVAFLLGIVVHGLLFPFGYRAYGAWAHPLRRAQGSIHAGPAVLWTLATALLALSLYSLDKWVLSLPIPDTSKWLFIVFALVCLTGGAVWAIVLARSSQRAHHSKVVAVLQSVEKYVALPFIGTAVGFGLVILIIAIFAKNNQVEQDADPVLIDPVTAEVSGAYVALGDSYSAGEGLSNVIPGLRPGCHRSVDAYPMLLSGASSSLQPVEFRACSGDVSYDVAYQIVGGHERQIDPVARRDVGLVTITIGGNDLTFSDVVQACLLFEDCIHEDSEPCEEDRSRPTIRFPDPQPLDEWASEALERILPPNLTYVFGELRKTYPRARILVLGYPYLFPDGEPWMWNVDCALVLTRVDEDERESIRLLTNRLNNLIFELARREDPEIEFISTVAAWHHHEPCGEDGQFTNAVKPAIQLLNPIDGGSFHPNEQGHRQLARLVSCYLNEFPEARPNLPAGDAPYGSRLPVQTDDGALACPELLGQADAPLPEAPSDSDE